MRKQPPVTNELSDLLLDCIEFGIFPLNTPGAAIATKVARKGLRGLSQAERNEWEQRVLPIVSLPIPELLKRAHFEERRWVDRHPEPPRAAA